PEAARALSPSSRRCSLRQALNRRRQHPRSWASPSSRRFRPNLADLGNAGSKLLHINYLAVARTIEIGKASFLDKAHPLNKTAPRRLAVGRGGVNIDVLGTGLAHGGLGAGIDMGAEAPALLLGCHDNPVKIERALRALNQPIAGVGHEPRAAFGENEVVARAYAFGKALGHEFCRDIDLGAGEHAGACYERAHAADVVRHHRAPPIEPVAVTTARRARSAAIWRRGHLPHRGPPGDEAAEEAPHIGAKRAHAITALLHHERGVALLADHASELLEILGSVWPSAGRIASRRVEAGAHHEERRCKPPDAAQSLCHGVSVLLGRDVLRQRNVEVETSAFANAGLVAETREIGIGEARMAMDRHGQYVGTIIEDLLLAVAVVIVDVEDRDLAVARQQVRGDGAVVEIAEAAEGACLGMMARRPH